MAETALVRLSTKSIASGESPRDEVMKSPYLGSEIDIEKLEMILGFKKLRYRKITDESDLCSGVAELLAAGNIVSDKKLLFLIEEVRIIMIIFIFFSRILRPTPARRCCVGCFLENSVELLYGSKAAFECDLQTAFVGGL